MVKDESKAVSWLEKAAALGHPSSQYNLGMLALHVGVRSMKLKADTLAVSKPLTTAAV